MEMELEDTFHTVVDAVVSEENLETFEQGPVAPLKSDQIIVRYVITGITFHIEEAMTKLVLETLMAQRKRVANLLTAALEPIIDCIVRKVMRSPKTIAELTEAVIDNHGFIARTDALFKPKQRK